MLLEWHFFNQHNNTTFTWVKHWRCFFLSRNSSVWLFTCLTRPPAPVYSSSPFFFCLLGHNGPLKHTHSNTHSTIHSYLSVCYDFETNLKSFYFDIRLFIPFICTLTHDRKKSLLMLSVQNILARNKKYKHRHLTFYRHALPHTMMFIEHMIYSSAFHPKQIFFFAVSYLLH